MFALACLFKRPKKKREIGPQFIEPRIPYLGYEITTEVDSWLLPVGTVSIRTWCHPHTFFSEIINSEILVPFSDDLDGEKLRTGVLATIERAKQFIDDKVAKDQARKKEDQRVEVLLFGNVS